MVCGCADMVCLCVPRGFSLGPRGWQQNIWLGSGREFWESHGILDALTEHRLSALGPFPTEEGEQSCCSECLCVWWCWAFRTSYGSWPRTMTGLQHSTRQAGSHVAKVRQRPGTEWALQQIWHNQIVQMISKAGYLYFCLRQGIRCICSMHCIPSSHNQKNLKALHKNNPRGITILEQLQF